MSCCTKNGEDMVELEEFLPYAEVQAPNAPAEMVAHYIRTAAIHLCNKSAILKEHLKIDVQANVQDYCIDLDTCDLHLRSVIEVCYHGRRLTGLDRMPCDGECVRGSSFYFRKPNNLYIWPAPTEDCDNALTVHAVMQPGQDACKLPRVLYDEYAEILGDGAASRLLLVKGADWYDPQAAGIYLRRFTQGVRTAKIEAERNYVQGPQYMKARRWL